MILFDWFLCSRCGVIHQRIQPHCSKGDRLRMIATIAVPYPSSNSPEMELKCISRDKHAFLARRPSSRGPGER